MPYLDTETADKLNSINLVDFLETHGYNLKKTGPNSWNLIIDGEVSSLAVFFSRQNNAWRWKRHSENVGGGSVTLLSHLENISNKEAMEVLLGEELPENREDWTDLRKHSVPEPPEPFTLPEKNRQCLNGKPPYSRLFGYLCNRRGIDRDIVRDMVDKKMLYLSHEELSRRQAAVHNCVFVGYDDAGEARWAAQKGTGNKSWSGTVTGSESKYAFYLPGTTNTIRAFEAPVDLLSYLTMCKIKGIDCKDHMVAQGGLFDHALHHRLEQNPGINKIVFCFDNDYNGTKKVMENGFPRRIPCNHGQEAAKEFSRKYAALGYDCKVHVPKEGKDWNDVLTFYRQMEAVSEDEKLSTVAASINASAKNAVKNPIVTLRDETGCNIADCKKAVAYAGDNHKLAWAYLRASNLPLNTGKMSFDERVQRFYDHEGETEEEFDREA